MNALEGYSADQRTQRVRPAYDDGELFNPHRGVATFQRFRGDPLDRQDRWDDTAGPLTFEARRDLGDDPSTLAYCRWLWRDLEPRRGEVRFDVLDGALATAAARGQTLQIRVQPYVHDDMPDWYWATGAAVDEAGSRRDKRPTPCVNDPRYFECFGELIRKLGQRYDGHPALESVDLAFGGVCGETDGNATPESARKFVELFTGAFQRTTLLAMLGTPSAACAASLPGVGWRADCLGDLRSDGRGVVPDGRAWNHMFDAYPRQVQEAGLQDAWLGAPVVFETCWTVMHWFNQGWDLDFILEQALAYHPTVFMPKSVRYPDAWREKLGAFSQRLGYRLHVQQVVLPIRLKAGAEFEVEVTLHNKGVAPLYRPYRLALRFSQSGRGAVVPLGHELRAVTPGLRWFSERLTAPDMLRPGRADVACAIVDSALVPVVSPASKPRDAQRFVSLTQVLVE